MIDDFTSQGTDLNRNQDNDDISSFKNSVFTGYKKNENNASFFDTSMDNSVMVKGQEGDKPLFNADDDIQSNGTFVQNS